MDKATKALTQRVAQLEKAVHALDNAPGKQDEKAIGKARDTEGESDGLTSAAPRFPDRNPTPEQASHTSKKWYQSFEWWKSRLEIVAIFAGVGYAIVTYFQWRDLRHNFEVDQRAWIAAYCSFSKGPATIVGTRLHNAGKSPVRSTHTHAFFKVVNNDEAPPFTVVGTNTISTTGPIFPGEDEFFPTSLRTESAPYGLIGFTPEQIVKLAEGKAYIAVYGEIGYEDQFGPHWTRFCRWHSYADPNHVDADFYAGPCVLYNRSGDGKAPPQNQP